MASKDKLIKGAVIGTVVVVGILGLNWLVNRNQPTVSPTPENTAQPTSEGVFAIATSQPEVQPALVGDGGFVLEKELCVAIASLPNMTFYSAVKKYQGENWDRTSHEIVVLTGSYGGTRKVEIDEGMNTHVVVYESDWLCPNNN